MSENEKTSDIFSEILFENQGEVVASEITETVQENAGTIRNELAPVKTGGFWKRFKAFWLQEIDWNTEIKVELTPKQQKIEDDINKFLHQEITWEKVHDFLFQEVKFGK